MPQILLVSATAQEIAPALQFLENYRNSREHHYTFENLHIEVCITGVGMVNTAFELGKINDRHFDLAINAGIAGSFSGFSTGEVLSVEEDCFSEWGAEDGDHFLRIEELGLGKQKVNIQNPFHSVLTDKLQKVSGITVNKGHGNVESIKKVLASHHPDIESMEGAAFMHAANAFHWTAIQLRAISNKVERRNRNNWDIPLAVKNLNRLLIELFKELNEKHLQKPNRQL